MNDDLGSTSMLFSKWQSHATWQWLGRTTGSVDKHTLVVSSSPSGFMNAWQPRQPAFANVIVQPMGPFSRPWLARSAWIAIGGELTPSERCPVHSPGSSLAPEQVCRGPLRSASLKPTSQTQKARRRQRNSRHGSSSTLSLLLENPPWQPAASALPGCQERMSQL